MSLKKRFLQRAAMPGWIPAPALAWKIALTYAVASALWILLSGHALHLMVHDDGALEMLEILKGWFFVVVTTMLLGLALQRYFSRIRQAGSQVHEAEKFATAVVNGLSSQIVVVDSKGGILAFNDAWRRFGAENGLAIESAGLGANYLEVSASALGPDAATAIAMAEGIRAVLAGQRASFELECSCHSPEVRRWFVARATPILDGPDRQVIIAHEDITQRRLQEEALRDSEERFRHTFEQAALGITHVGLDNRWLRVNQRFCDIIGCTREEILKKSWQDFTHPSDLESDIDFMRQLVEGAIPDFSLEKRYRRPNGSWVWARLTVSLVRENSTSPAYFVTVVEDIQARREMESALQMQHAALEDALNGFDIVDEDGRFVYVNRACLRMWGHDRPEALIGASPVSLYQDPAMLLHTTTALLKTGEDVREFTARRRDGSTFEALMAAKRFTSPDGRVLFIRSSLDITERKKVQEAMQQRLELQDQLARVAASVPGVIYTFRLRPDGTASIPFASEGLESIFGIVPEKLREDAAILFTMIHPEDLSQARESIAESARSLNPWQAEFRVRHPRLGEIWIEGRSVPQREADGSILWHGFVHEVTGRKEVENKLAASEQKYRHLYQSTLDGFVCVSMDGRILETNQVYLDMLGYTADEASQLRYPDITPERWRAMEARIVADQILPRGFSDIYEKEYRRKDGTVIPIELRTYLIKDETGAPAGMWAFIRDISERKRAEAELQQQVERYDLVVSGVRDAIWDWDVLRQRVFYSPRWKAFRGYAEDEVSDSQDEWTKHIHPDDAPRVTARLQAHFAGETDVFQEEYRVQCKDGSWKWILDRGVAQRGAAGQVIRMAGSETDITERKQAEQRMADALAYNRLLIQSSTVGVATFRASGEVVTLNPAIIRMIGGTEEQLLSQNFRQYESWKASGLLAAAEAVLATGEPQRLDARFVSSFGREVYCSIQFVRLQFDGEAYLLALYTDTSEREKAAMALRQSEERLHQALQSSGGGAWDWDLRGGEAWWSPEMYELLGIVPGTSMRPENSLAIIHEQDREALRRTVEDAIAQHKDYSSEYRIRHATRGERWIAARGRVVCDAAGQPDRLVGISLDVTVRKKAEVKINEQLDELRRWQQIMLGREDRVLELKREVNELCRSLGDAVRYPSQEEDPTEANSAV